MNTELKGKHKRSMRAKLIFNPSAGAARPTPVEIVDVIHEMQSWKFVPEAFLVELGCDLSGNRPGCPGKRYSHVRRMWGRWDDISGSRNAGWDDGHPGDHTHRHPK